MNCTQFDEVQRNIETFFVDTDLGTAAGLGAVVVVSLALLVRGEKLVRPLGAVLGGLAGVVVAFMASAAAGIEACEVRIVAAGIAGVLLAVVALCLLKAGLFLLGAAGMGVVGHLAYVSLPIDASGAPFELLGIPAYHYFAVGGAAIFGGVVSQLQKAFRADRLVRLGWKWARGVRTSPSCSSTPRASRRCCRSSSRWGAPQAAALYKAGWKRAQSAKRTGSGASGATTPSSDADRLLFF